MQIAARNASGRAECRRARGKAGPPGRGRARRTLRTGAGWTGADADLNRGRLCRRLISRIGAERGSMRAATSRAGAPAIPDGNLDRQSRKARSKGRSHPDPQLAQRSQNLSANAATAASATAIDRKASDMSNWSSRKLRRSYSRSSRSALARVSVLRSPYFLMSASYSAACFAANVLSMLPALSRRRSCASPFSSTCSLTRDA